MRRTMFLCVAWPLMLLLAGCGAFEIETTINPDGSGERSVSVAIERKLYDTITTAGADPLAELRSVAGEIGARVEPINDSEMAGVKLVQTFASVDDLAAQSLIGEAEALSVEHDDAWFKTTYRYVARLDASQFGLLEVPEIDRTFGRAELSYVLTLPGTITEENASDVKGGTLTWTLDPTTRATYDLFATTVVTHSGRIALTIAGGLVALALLGVIGWAVFQKVMRI